MKTSHKNNSDIIEYRQQFQSQEIADIYDARYANPENYGNLLFKIEQLYLSKQIDAMTKEHLRIEMLDFACGTGRITAFLENMVDRSVGLDISMSMLRRAKAKTRHTEFVHGDITTDPELCLGPFDLIVTFRFITNAEPELREAVLLQLRQRLRNKNSRLIFNVHRNLHSYLLFHWGLQKVRPDTNHVWNYLTIQNVRNLTRRCGLEIEHTIGFGFLSSHIATRLGFNTALQIEKSLSRIPILNHFGSEFIVICRPI